MKLAYDFHIHTGASPCGDKDMTPNNIVNMSILKGLDAIAITDHHTCANVSAVMDVAKNTQLTIIPGMEIETSEEVHMIALFSTLEVVKQMEDIVHNHLPPIKNRIDIFGEQLIYNDQDEKTGEIDRLLLTATSLSVYDVVNIVRSLGGVCYPAHIDKGVYSIISNLGFIPPDLSIQNLEISRRAEVLRFQEKYPLLRVMQSSDAHYLGDILERQSYMEISKNTPCHWIELLKQSMNIHY